MRQLISYPAEPVVGPNMEECVDHLPTTVREANHNKGWEQLVGMYTDY